jgi:hypothetical protein
MFNPEQIVAGYDEINRKRRVITRILSSLIAIIQDSGKVWSKEEIICRVDLPSSDFLQLKAERGRRSDGFRVIADMAWQWLPELGESLPYAMVQPVYDYLPNIIQAVDEAVGSDRVKNYCSFFASQAPR